MYQNKLHLFTYFCKRIILDAKYSQQTMEEHIVMLEKHCRVCGERLEKAKKKSFSYACSQHRKALRDTFDIDVSSDVRSVFPEIFCSSCFLKTRHQAAWLRKGLPYNFALTAFSWSPHSSSSTVRETVVTMEHAPISCYFTGLYTINRVKKRRKAKENKEQWAS